MLNSYVDSGYKPVPITEKNKHAIELFLAHIKNMLSDEKEQTILLDWLAYVVQNAGKRVNWAIFCCKGRKVQGRVTLLRCLSGCWVAMPRA